MPSKKKKYNARFPAGRIKKIMQTDEEVGKVAQAVPIIISRTLELFVESLITKSMHVTLTKNARTLSPHHMKQCIFSESRFDFLRDLVKNLPDSAASDDDNYTPSEHTSSSRRNQRVSSDEFSDTPKMEIDESKFSKDGENSESASGTGLNFYMETNLSNSNGSSKNKTIEENAESDDEDDYDS